MSPATLLTKTYLDADETFTTEADAEPARNLDHLRTLRLGNSGNDDSCRGLHFLLSFRYALFVNLVTNEIENNKRIRMCLTFSNNSQTDHSLPLNF